MELNEVYFYTATIVDWVPLLKSDKFKQIILDSLAFLVKKRKIRVYRFVIMPNHIHLNPLQAHWNLANDPNNYFSSCSFYEQGDQKFNWLTHYMDLYD